MLPATKARATSHLSPLAGRGRERSERVRGTLDELRVAASPPHPTAFAVLRRSTSPRKRGEVEPAAPLCIKLNKVSSEQKE